METTDK